MKVGMLKSLALIMILSASLFAAGPGKGSMSKYDFKVGKCKVDSMKVIWKVDSLMGEATVNGKFKWKGRKNCKLPYSTVIWLKIQNNNGGKGYIKIAPTVAKMNGKYGYNTTGSPSWSNAVCGYSGKRKTNCLSSKSAKHIWKTGRITDFIVQW